jgi:hypothetical protein
MKRLKNNPLAVICLLLSFGATALIAFETVHAGPPSSTLPG